jgi:hypothetical protein
MSDINQHIDINNQTIQLIETLIDRIKILEEKLAKIENKQQPARVHIPVYDYSHLNLKEQCYY